MADPPPEQDLAPLVYRQREAAAAVFARVREMSAQLDAAGRATSRRSVVRAAPAGRLPG